MVNPRDAYDRSDERACRPGAYAHRVGHRQIAEGGAGHISEQSRRGDNRRRRSALAVKRTDGAVVYRVAAAVICPLERVGRLGRDGLKALVVVSRHVYVGYLQKVLVLRLMLPFFKIFPHGLEPPRRGYPVGVILCARAEHRRPRIEGLRVYSIDARANLHHTPKMGLPDISFRVPLYRRSQYIVARAQAFLEVEYRLPVADIVLCLQQKGIFGLFAEHFHGQLALRNKGAEVRRKFHISLRTESLFRHYAFVVIVAAARQQYGRNCEYGADNRCAE